MEPRSDRGAGRPGRSWSATETLEGKGVALRILNFGGDNVDTKGATGKLILNVFGAMAQFEREHMLECQREGIAREGRGEIQRPETQREIEGCGCSQAGQGGQEHFRGGQGFGYRSRLCLSSPGGRGEEVMSKKIDRKRAV
jgi:hypothetical protein